MPTRFSLPAHHDFVLRHAEAVRISRAHKCACGARPDANRANVNCQACFGAGYLYDPPYVTRGAVIGIQAQRIMLETGVADLGDLLLSLSPFEPEQIRDWDKVEIVGWDDGELFSGEVLVRGGGPYDRLTYEPVVFHKAFTVFPSTGVITMYVEGTSFTLAGRNLTWVPGQPQPTYMQTYTADYSPRYEWVAFNPQVHRYEQAENLGQRVLLKRRHVVLPN